MKCLIWRFFAVLLLVAGLSACDESRVYTHYESTPITGWEKNDTIFFHTSPIARSGRYRVEVGLRTTADYPFTAMTMKIEAQNVTQQTTDTYMLGCTLMDSEGNNRGKGIGIYQYTFPLTDLELHEGDSLVFRFRHDMKREILPGISDVGVLITRR